MHRYGLEAVEDGVRARVHPEAVAEDRAYRATLALYTYDRWKYLTMPTLLLRATQEFRPSAGRVVPATDVERFLREVARSSVVEVDANHLTINTHPDTATSIRDFVAAVLG